VWCGDIQTLFGGDKFPAPKKTAPPTTREKKEIPRVTLRVKYGDWEQGGAAVKKHPTRCSSETLHTLVQEIGGREARVKVNDQFW